MKGKTKIKTISKTEFYSLVGMLILANKLWKKIDLLAIGFAEILKLKGEDAYDKGGYLLMDNLSERDALNAIKKGLKMSNIKVK